MTGNRKAISGMIRFQERASRAVYGSGDESGQSSRFEEEVGWTRDRVAKAVSRDIFEEFAPSRGFQARKPIHSYVTRIAAIATQRERTSRRASVNAGEAKLNACGA